MRLDPESGRLEKEDDAPLAKSSPVEIPPLFAREGAVPELVLEAMRGEMPLTRPLKSWEPEKLSPTHVQMIFDRAMGLKNTEIAEKFAVDAGRVCVILNHPFATRIMGAIFATLSERVSDPIERMRGHSHEMVDIKLSLVRDSATPRELRNKIASDFLDRSGYGAKKQVEVSTVAAPSVPAAAVTRLTEVLAEVRQGPGASYQRYLRNAARQEGEGSVPDPVDEDSRQESSQTSGASPIGPPLSLERTA